MDVRFAGERVEKSGKKAEKGTVVPEVEKKKSVKREADAVAEPVDTGMRCSFCRRNQWLHLMKPWKTTRTRRLFPQRRRRRVERGLRG